MNEKYYGNYRGFVLYNQDTSHSGRVKVWVPAVNGRNFDLTGGNSLIGGLNEQEVEDWKHKLPWAVTAQSLVGGGGGAGEYSGKQFQVGDGTQTSGVNNDSVNDSERVNMLKNLPNTKRGSSGVHITSYGQVNDSTPDTNTIEKRGFRNNLLREGSVALSPQIYEKYNPPIGSIVYVDGQQIGFYEDRAPSGYNGQSYGQTIDVYDPKNNLGPILKNAGNDAKITFGPPRDQILNDGVTPTEPVAPVKTQKAGEAFAPSYHNFRVTSDTRDQMGGSTNVKKKGRPISLDFNSAGGGAGIMIVAPSDVTSIEKQFCEQYLQGVSEFFAQHSTDPKSKKINSNPIRIKGKDNKRGINGFFHTEPFDQDEAAMDAIRRNPQQYASVIASTLGKIPNALIFTPHSSNDGGAAFDGTNERDFAREYIIPYLASADNTLVVDAYSSIGNTHPEELRESNFLKSIEVPQTDIDDIVKVGKELYELKRKNKSSVGGGDTTTVAKLEEDRAELWLNLPIDDESYKEQKTQYLSRYDLNYTDVPMVSKVNPAALSFGGNNYSNVTKGSFVIPDVGSKVWVFFEGGDIDSPVVFANNPSTQDYAGIYAISSESTNPPRDKKNNIDEENIVRSQYVMNNRGGSIEFVGTTGNERVKLTSFHGSSLDMNKLGMNEFVVGNKSRLVTADSFNTVRGDDLNFVDHDQSHVVKGDISTMCGDVRQNVETAQKMYGLHRPIHDKIRLFDLQRTEFSDSLEQSPLQTKNGENSPCQVCSSDKTFPTQTNKASQFKPANTSNSGTKEVLTKGKSSQEDRTVSTASCTSCGGTGVSLTSAEGEFKQDAIKKTINDDINNVASKMSELENELGDGGHDTKYISKSQTIHIGSVINQLESIRVDPTGKRALIGQQPASDGSTVIPLTDPIPHVEAVATASLAGGDYSMMVANKYNLMVGANGINMKTLGEYNIQGRILTLMAEQVIISSNNQVTIDGGRNISLVGDSITLTPRTQTIGGDEYKSLALDGTVSISNNAVVKGGMHVEGQFSTQHITAPLEYQETETTLSYSDLIEGQVIGTVMIDGVPKNVTSVAVPNFSTSAHSHTFANAPMTLVPTNDDVRKNATNMSKSKPVMAQPVEHGKTRLKNYATIRYFNPDLYELYEDCNDDSNGLASLIDDLEEGKRSVEDVLSDLSYASQSSIASAADEDCKV
jgi:hypothetical protein